MRPAGSIVFFTTASGAGYGMLFWLGLLATFGMLPASPALGLTALGIALVLITAGLLSSTAHLGHPERAWRALSQWRTSWLSREGVLAILTYIPAGLLGLQWLTSTSISPLLGLLAAAGAVLTVICTGMIYASLKPIRQWNQPLVVPFYLLAASFSGAACLAAVIALFGAAATGLLAALAILGAAAAAMVKLAYWRAIDAASPASSIASATGLGALGPVRSFEAPHTSDNYLLHEMGFRIARKHAAKLRVYAAMLAFCVPVAILVGLVAGVAPAPVAVVAALAGLLGLLLERWLFFAEATHTVTLYYQR